MFKCSFDLDPVSKIKVWNVGHLIDFLQTCIDVSQGQTDVDALGLIYTDIGALCPC